MVVAKQGEPKCRHCSMHKVNRPRGLCWACYYTPGVRVMYPAIPADVSGAMNGRGKPRPKSWA